MIKRVENSKEKKRISDNKILLTELNAATTLEDVKEVVKKILEKTSQ